MRGSRQFGHKVVCGTRKASCARRLSRRALECRRLGFGIITPFYKLQIADFQLPIIKFFNRQLAIGNWQFYFNFLRAAQRGSISLVTQLHSPVFLSGLHSGQMPFQSSRQSMRVGTASKTCSFTISSTSIASPSNTETDISASVNSAAWLDS